jgi:propane monooxygenase large subunit
VPHDLVNDAWERLSVKGFHHKLAMNLAALWPFNFWRFDGMDERDFEWFESKYPGWYNEYGKFWERYRETHLPGNPLFCGGAFGYSLPYMCWSCLSPVVVREDLVVGEVNGQIYTYCSEHCHWTHKVFSKGGNSGRTPHTGLFSGQRDWLSIYDNQDAATALQDAGLVRQDGRTFVAQPHLIFDEKAMWTLDHGFRGFGLQSPLRLLREMSPADREKAVAAYRAGITIS